MRKSDYAHEMNTILNTYLDYLEFGFKQDHPESDFSHLDSLPEPVTPLAPKTEGKSPGRTPTPPAEGSPGKKRALIDLAATILTCNRCSLHSKASQKVPGAGNTDARLFIITFPVSPDEEKGGIPFAHHFREDLAKWLKAIDIELDQVFIVNILKCCPHKAPLQKEHFETCRFYLEEQINLVNPEVIMTLGQVTVSSLMRNYINLQEKHGAGLKLTTGVPVIPTFHPFEVQKSPALKRAVWEDLKKIKQLLGT